VFRTGILTVACSALVLAGACSRSVEDENTPADQAVAAGQTPAATSADRADTAGDARGFIEQAAIANMAEIQLGNLALQRAQRSDVKQFARMMVTDHTKALAELRTAAQPVGVTLPADLDDKHHDMYQRLSSLQGSDFDHEYMKAMVEGHEDVADLLNNRAQGRNGVSDAAGASASARPGEAQTEGPVNQWAARTLPAVRAHLDRAKAISAKLK
jgi:putative membrane protein